MPYEGETANKTTHSDLVRNPDVASFLSECDYIRPPSTDEVQIAIARFEVPPITENAALPERVIAVDGSYHESSIDERLPSTKVGYVKVGSVLVDMAQFRNLRDDRHGLVDPMRVARLHESNSPLTFVLPSANIRWKERESVREGFRAAVDDYLYGVDTRFDKDDPKTSLRSTLFHLAARRPGEMGTNDPTRLRIHQCPSCNEGLVDVYDRADAQWCSFCGSEVFPSDCLRLWEEVSEHQSNVQALSRFMLAIEHLVPIHYVRYLAENSLHALGSTAFFVDGPLAVFANPAWLHAPIMRYLAEINHRLESAGQYKLLIIGLQKSGQVVDHMEILDRFLPPNRIFPIDDEYRYNHILVGRERVSTLGFGGETHYGQDFIYKTPTGRSFVFALPYPVSSKYGDGLDFARVKTELGRYTEMQRALALIDHFESDLYKNAVVPVALAHRYTAISLVPGGRVLDLLTKKQLPPLN